MKKIISKLVLYWDEEKSLSTMLWLLLLFIFVFVPLVRPEGTGGIIIRIVYSLMLFTGIFSVSRRKKTLVIASIFAIVAMIANWLAEFETGRFIMIANDFSALLFNLFFAIAILIKTFKPGEITFRRIEGSIVVYLLAGLMFTYAYHAIYLISGPEAFNNIGGPVLKHFLYYSFVTLTTVGYGDITPVSPVARSLANLESLIGQLYPAILIARLVSMEFESSTRRKEKK